MHNKQQLLDNLFIYSLTALTSSLLCFSPFLHPLFSCIKVLLVLPIPQIAPLFFNSKFVFVVGNLIFIVLIGDSKIYTSYATFASGFYYKSLANLSRPKLIYPKKNLSHPDKKVEEKLEKFFNQKIMTSCEGGEGEVEEWVEEKQDIEDVQDGEGDLEEWVEEKQDVEDVQDGEGDLDEWIEEKQDTKEDLEAWLEEIRDAEEELDGEGKLEAWIDEKQEAEEELDGEGFDLPVEELNKRVDDFIARVQKRRSLELLAYRSK